MNRLKKILIIPVILSCFSLSITSADNSDCGKFGAMSYSKAGSFDIVDTNRETDNNRFTNFLTIEEQKAIITKDDLNTALLNLKKYCCEEELGGLKQSYEVCQKDSPYFNDNALESQYLFDHILDVVRRRLKGLTGKNDIYTKTNMSVDDKGLERRQRINEQAKSISGSTPQIIQSKYKEVFSRSPANLGYNIASRVHNSFITSNDQIFLTYMNGGGESIDSESMGKALKEYNNRTLGDRYANSCAISEYFYSLLNVGVLSEDKMQTTKILSTPINNTGRELPCDDIINRQLRGENAYVELVTRESSNLLLSNYIQGYFSYINERQKSFTKLWKDSANKRLDVVRAIPCLQHSCVK